MKEHVPEASIKALRSMNEAALAAGRSLAPLSSALQGFGAQIYAMLWDAYMKAGAPYGKTHKGLMRWMSEQTTAQHISEE